MLGGEGEQTNKQTLTNNPLAIQEIIYNFQF